MNQLKRWITSIVALPLLILLISKGSPTALTIFLTAVSLIAMYEYFHIVLIHYNATVFSLIPILGFISSPAIIFSAGLLRFDFILAILVFNLILSGFFSQMKFKNDPSLLTVVFLSITGLVYIPVFLSNILLLRLSDHGTAWIFLVISVVFAVDTGAYYVGTYFGKRKLCPAVSPGKTIEGAVGGLLAGLFAGLVFSRFFLPGFDWSMAIPLFIIMGISSQVGDLFESQLKRVSNIKDSGTILPGHGGILDRIDGLLFALPVAYIFKRIMMISS